MSKIWFLMILVLAPLQSYALDVTSPFYTRHAAQRQIYLELKRMLVEGNLAEVAVRKKELGTYPLTPYLEYLLLRKRLEASTQPIRMLTLVDAFVRDYDDKRLQRRLLGVLKNRTATLKQWQDYAVIAKLANAPVHPCDDLLSKVHNKQINRLDASARALWVLPAKHTKSCDKAFSRIIGFGHGIPAGTLWRRSVSLIVNGQQDEARSLLRYFNRRDRNTITAWIEGVREPEKLLRSRAVEGNSEHHRRLVKYLLHRWQRKDIVAAGEFWISNGNRLGFSQADIAATISKYAVLAAKRGLPEASRLLQQAESNRGVRYWRVRMALRAGDWHAALQRLDQLSESEQKSVRWRYWRARSLGELGYRSAAVKIYRKLAGKFEYYGFLAADQLTMAYNIEASVPFVDRAAVDGLTKSRQLERAIEFFLVGTGWEGRREWNKALKGAPHSHLIAAAQVAYSLDWHDRAFASMRLTNEKDALSLLFPTPHQELVDVLASRLSVPSEFVYGVMKQESSFIPDIKSPAGAIGLMQLMPATARDMGKKIGVKAPPWKLTNSTLNIQLGIKYLEYVLGRFGKNTVLAAAAYNAGPHRVSRWLDDSSLAADIWVETIPFDETRHYVKAVLFNTTVLDWRRQGGALTRLKVRMPDVLPLG